MFNKTTKHMPNLAKMMAVAVVGYAYANLGMMFVFQHLLPVDFIWPTLIFLTTICGWLTHLSATRIIFTRLNLIPVRLRLGFITLMMLMGVLFFVQGPYPVPSNLALNTGTFADAYNATTGFFTVVIVGATGMLTLILLAVGRTQPIVPRFIVVTGMISLYMLVGLLIYSDYGITVDEFTQRDHGRVSLNYVLQQADLAFATDLLGEGIINLQEYESRYYPVAFHLPLVFVESLNNMPDDTRQLWLFRHYAMFLFFFLGVLAFFRLVYEQFKSWILGVVGAVFLVCMPLIFAHTFNNIKDPVFVSAYIIALYFGLRYWRRKSITSALAFAVGTAFASNVRIVAAFIPVAIVGLTLLDQLKKSRRQQRTVPQLIGGLLTFLVMFTLFHVLFHPASWSDPIGFNLDALTTFSNYEVWDGQVFYRGAMIYGQSAPWHYLPVWILITIPVGYLALFALGAVATLYALVRRHIHILTDERREDVMFLAMFTLPILALILLQSTMYNDWRQFYFLYVPFVLVMVRGVEILAEWYTRFAGRQSIQLGLLGVFALLALHQIHLVGWMFANHPHQIVYRSSPAVEILGGRENFARDNMRSSTKQAMKHITSIDESDEIVIWLGLYTTTGHYQILPREHRERIRLVEDLSNGADYVINLYVYPLQPFEFDEIYSVSVDGVRVFTVYSHSTPDE